MIELVVLGATLALAAGASGATVRRRLVAARSFEQYARRRSHRFVPAPRGGQSPRIEGAKDDVPFTVDFVRVSGAVRTRIRAPVVKGPGAKLAVVQKGVLARALGGSDAGRRDDAVGIPAFDAAYEMHGMAPDEARAWVAGVLAALTCLDERRDVWIGSDGVTVTMLWGGVEKNPVLIDAARDLTVSLASWHRPETPYR